VTTQLDPTDEIGGMCPVNRDKKTADTSTLSIIDLDEKTRAFELFAVTYSYR
jgi:hypothetical protein